MEMICRITACATAVQKRAASGREIREDGKGMPDDLPYMRHLPY